MQEQTRLILRPLAVALLLGTLQGQTPGAPSKDSDVEIERFLKTGQIVSSKLIGEGVTKSSRATLSFQGRVHDAQVQSINKKLNDLYDPDGKHISQVQVVT